MIFTQTRVLILRRLWTATRYLQPIDTREAREGTFRSKGESGRDKEDEEDEDEEAEERGEEESAEAEAVWMSC